MCGIAPHVEFARRACRTSRRRDRSVETQCLAHRVEIAHGHAGGVETHALALLVQGRRAVACRSAGSAASELLPIIRVVAGQRRGSPGTALIDQHDVVIAVDPRECRRQAHVHRRRALARSTGQQKQRRRRAAPVERRHDCDASSRWWRRRDASDPRAPRVRRSAPQAMRDAAGARGGIRSGAASRRSCGGDATAAPAAATGRPRPRAAERSRRELSAHAACQSPISDRL